MKVRIFFMLCSLVLSSAFCISAEPPPAAPEDSVVQAAVQHFKQQYSAELAIGKPVEVNGLKIIPLVTAGIGIAPHTTRDNPSGVPALGGFMSPVGVIVVSGNDVRIVQISKGLAEQLAGALAPIALQLLQQRGASVPGDAPSHEQTPPTASPQSRNFSFAYLKAAIAFWILWAIIAVLVQKFLPDKVAAIAAGFRYHTVQISLLGLAGFGFVFFLAIVFTISLVGIPFTFALFLLGGIFTLFGSIGLALFIGQQSATAFKYHYSEARLMLIGGGLFGLLGMIPIIGILTWTLVAIFGFGAVLQNQRENLYKRTL